jgi:hypothetical protein
VERLANRRTLEVIQTGTDRGRAGASFVGWNPG